MTDLRQLDLLNWTPRLGTVADGETFEVGRDGKRLNDQLLRVFKAMRDGDWHTLYELHELTGDPEQSISARLRDLRKPKILGAVVDREHVANGVFRYRLDLESVRVR